MSKGGTTTETGQGDLERQNAALREDREQLRRLVEARTEMLSLTSYALSQVREAAYLIAEDARFLYVNDEACRATGYSAAELLRMGVLDVDPVWDRPRWDESWNKLRDAGSLVFETIHRRNDGSEFPVEVRASYFEYGGKEYNLALVRDITEQKRTEALLSIQRELEAQLSGLAETTSDIICRYDRARRLVYANSALVAALGRPLQELLGKTPTERASGLQYVRYEAAIAEVIESGAEHDVEITVPDAGGRLRYHHVRIVAQRGAHGEIAGALVLGRDITERKEEQDRLHASEEAFRAVVEHSPDYIARYDLSFRRIYISPSILALMGLPASDVIGTRPSERSSFVDADQYMAWLRHVAQTGEEITGEVRFRDASGRIRWGHMRIVPELAPGGAVASVLAIMRDIDELKRSEQLFRTLAENFPDIIARFDGECRHLYANPAVATAFGVAQEAFIGKRPTELAPATVAGQNERLEAGIRRAFAEGELNEDEVRWQTSQGTRVFDIRHIPEKDAEGRVVSVLGVARDITRLRATEQTARDSERAFRTLAENAPDPIIRYDRECRRIYVNPEFERIIGTPSEELLGEPGGHGVRGAPDLIVTLFRMKVKAILASGEAAKFELAWDSNGKPQCWYVHAVPEYDAEGGIQSVLTVWRDISERKEAEQRLRESYELLRGLTSRRETAREEERKRIARELHDGLGQHLTALRMGASAVRMQFGHENPALAEHVRKMLALTDETMQVVRDVVASLRPAVLDAGIAAALEWLAVEFSRNGRIPCRLRMPEESLPLSDERATAVFRIVQEALTNVARHADAREVWITLTCTGGDCFLEVRDDGRGFDPVAIRRKSFGLAGMKERVLMLGGEIAIVSAPNLGTSINVRVPMAAPA
ncbi:sensor histidine kinase [Trinickia terrae]|nr:PAS domain S-box protein [Trinickia terrae]